MAMNETIIETTAAVLKGLQAVADDMGVPIERILGPFQAAFDKHMKEATDALKNEKP